MRRPNGPAPRLIARFPSEEHYEDLKSKGFEGHVIDEDLWAWHAYAYGWRRVMLQTRDDALPIDDGKHWFSAELAAQAEAFYSKKFRERAPPLESATQQGLERTPEELACVENCMREIRANLARFQHRNRSVMEDDHRGALQRVREELGVTATEVPDSDHHGGSNERSRHDQEVERKVPKSSQHRS
jgi:hypothetical protein